MGSSEPFPDDALTTGESSALGARIDAITRYLPALETPGAAGRWEGGDESEPGVIQMPWFSYSEEVLAFIQACYENDWVDSAFNWVEWQDDALRYWDSPDLLADASPQTLQRLLTVHLRKDRFVEGHLASAIENGHLAAILHRLQHIRASL